MSRTTEEKREILEKVEHYKMYGEPDDVFANQMAISNLLLAFIAESLLDIQEVLTNEANPNE